MTHRVLIVDDHSDFRKLARAVLERDGFDVVGEAVDGSTALAAVAAIHPDVVLLDVQLPDANGFDIARSLGATADGPIVVMTSTRDLADYGGRLAASGARGFIPKSRLSGRMLAQLVKG